MRNSWAKTIRHLLVLTALCAAQSLAQQAPPGMQHAGLAIHQETGRSIYLASLYVDATLTRPFDYAGDSGSKMMAYHVVARRTSMRSLLGSMLLQSEVATDTPPNSATNTFARDILAAVQGSLYAGDRLELKLSPDGDTLALLNTHPLARSAGPGVLNYMIMGWVGERGSATAFRDSLLADEIDPELLALLAQTTYSDERLAQVAAWSAPQEAPLIAETESNQVAAVAIAAPVEIVPEKPATSTATAVSAAALDEVQLQAQARFSLPIQGPEPAAEVHASVPGPTENTIQLASLSPSPGMIEDSRMDIANMDIKLYSQRLSTFHTGVVSKVYGEIRYPRRAVRRGLQGRLELDLTLEQDGSLLQVSVVQSSGHSILDEAAVEAAEQAFGTNALGSIDPVAVAEFSIADSGKLVIPVPVTFMLTQ